MIDSLGSQLVIGDTVCSVSSTNGIVSVLFGSVIGFSDKGKVSILVKKRGTALYEAPICNIELSPKDKKKVSLFSNRIFKCNLSSILW